MREPLLVGLLAMALFTSACSSLNPEPLPSATANGLITEITNPEAPFAVAWTTAVGDDGSALVTYMSRFADYGSMPPSTGIALVYRDGTYDTIVEPGDPRFADEWPTFGKISDSTVAWITNVGEDGTEIHFWDRKSHRISDGPTTVTEGDLKGMPVNPTSPDLVLVGGVLYWIQTNPDAVDLQHFEVIVAATGEGRGWIPVAGEENWFRMGEDACASEPGHPVLWAEEQFFTDETSDFRFWQIDASDPRQLTVIEGSQWATDRTADTVKYTFGIRCGDEVLGVGNPDAFGTELSDRPLVLVDGNDPAGVTVLEIENVGMPFVASLASKWIAVPTAMFSSTGGHLIDRVSGVIGELPAEGVCTSIEIHGDFVSWEAPARGSVPSLAPLAATCDTYVGLLTPPAG